MVAHGHVEMAGKNNVNLWCDMDILKRLRKYKQKQKQHRLREAAAPAARPHQLKKSSKTCFVEAEIICLGQKSASRAKK